MNRELNEYFDELRTSLQAEMPIDEVRNLVYNHPVSAPTSPNGTSFLNGTNMTITLLSVVAGTTLYMFTGGPAPEPSALQESTQAPTPLIELTSAPKTELQGDHAQEALTTGGVSETAIDFITEAPNSPSGETPKKAIPVLSEEDTPPAAQAVADSDLIPFRKKKTLPGDGAHVTWGQRTDDPPRPLEPLIAEASSSHIPSSIFSNPPGTGLFLEDPNGSGAAVPSDGQRLIFTIKSTDTREEIEAIQKAMEENGIKANLKASYRNGEITSLKGKLQKGGSNTNYVVTDFEVVEITVKLGKKGELLGVDIASDDNISLLNRQRDASQTNPYGNATPPTPNAIPTPMAAPSPVAAPSSVGSPPHPISHIHLSFPATVFSSVQEEEEFRAQKLALEAEAMALAEEARAMAEEVRAALHSFDKEDEDWLIQADDLESQADNLEEQAELLEEKAEILMEKEQVQLENIEELDQQIEELMEELEILEESVEAGEAGEAETSELHQTRERIHQATMVKRQSIAAARIRHADVRRQTMAQQIALRHQAMTIRKQALEMRKHARERAAARRKAARQKKESNE